MVHGKEGKQTYSKIEFFLHSLVLVFAAVVIYFFAFPRTNLYYHPIEANSIAVLPFKNFSEANDEYFSDGVTEDILTNLSKIHGLNVTSRTSVMKYKDSDKSIGEIGNELGVETILEGSVRQYGTKVRITGQLIDTKTDKHIWAESYDREMKDIFNIQSEVAQKIAKALQKKLSPEEKLQIETKPTENIEAYALYLKGRELYNQYEKTKNETAIEYFKKAIKLDSSFALAYAGLADAYVQKNSKFWQTKEWVDSAKIMAERSLQLNPDLAEGYKALGLVYDTNKDYDNALYNYNRAIEINPNYAPAIANSADVYYAVGRIDEAIRHTEKSIKIAPDNLISYVLAGICYDILNDTSKALEWYNKALIIEPELPFAQYQLGWHYLLENNIKKAVAIKDSLMKTNPEWPFTLDYAAGIAVELKNYQEAKKLYLKYYELSGSEADYHLGYVYKKLGMKKESEKVLNDQILRNAELLPQKYVSEYTFMDQCYDYALLGRKEEAVKFLQLTIDKGYRDYRWLLFDPMLEDLKDYPAFITVVNNLKKQVKVMRNNLERTRTEI